MNGELHDLRPGVRLARLARLVRESIERTQLNLKEIRVLTEAASGPYVVTPVIAALAGADVTALTQDSRFGTAKDVAESTLALARLLGVEDRILVTKNKHPELYSSADVITNSGHVRPITGKYADAIRSGAVVSLMYETWELQEGRIDLDIQSLRMHGVSIAGTNERHPDVDVFSYLGLMAITQLADAGVAAYGARIALLCNNPFEEYLVRGLDSVGAEVSVGDNLAALLDIPRPDALVVALKPVAGHALPAPLVDEIAGLWPGVIVCQFWGDIDRTACTRRGLNVWPIRDPGRGHMGVLPSRVGPEPIVRLQTGGLKVAEVLRIPTAARTERDWDWLDGIR